MEILLLTGYFRSLAERAENRKCLLVVGAQMSDGRLAALIGTLRPKSRIALNPAICVNASVT